MPVCLSCLILLLQLSLFVLFLLLLLSQSCTLKRFYFLKGRNAFQLLSLLTSMSLLSEDVPQPEPNPEAKMAPGIKAESEPMHKPGIKTEPEPKPAPVKKPGSPSAKGTFCLVYALCTVFTTSICFHLTSLCVCVIVHHVLIYVQLSFYCGSESLMYVILCTFNILLSWFAKY